MKPVDQPGLDERLSRISTQWTLVLHAHQGLANAALAQKELLHRYGGAVYRYLLGAVRDPDAAEDLAQEFALRFVRGDFRRANPERGRFRDFLKTALIHLVTDHHRARQARPLLLDPDAPEPAAPSLDSGPGDADFLASWREELLHRTWKALAQANPVYHGALLLRVTEPEITSPQMAERLTAQLGKPLSAALVRKALQRAHSKFAELLLEEVAGSLGTATREALQEELAELDLLRYCRSALERRGK